MFVLQVEPDAKIITKLQELLECNAALQKVRPDCICPLSPGKGTHRPACAAGIFAVVDF